MINQNQIVLGGLASIERLERMVLLSMSAWVAA
jgi:hypothetical protein